MCYSCGMKNLISLALLVLGLIHAQALPCEGLFANYPAPKVTFTSLEQVITSSMTVNGQITETVMRQVIDYTNRRFYQESDVGVTSIMRYADGKASMSMKVGDNFMNVPIPEDQAQGMDSIFDQGVVQGLPTNVTVTSCDGQQSYAGLLSGEQATITTEVPGMSSLTFKVIFGDSGKPLGSVSSFGGEILTVFEEMTLDDQNVPVHIKMTMYRLNGDEATLFSTTTTDTTSYNQPVDEALFTE